jgi:hypothetical protein
MRVGYRGSGPVASNAFGGKADARHRAVTNTIPSGSIALRIV